MILITGGKGMLGRTLGRYFDRCDRRLVDVEDFDICDPHAVHTAFITHKPDVVIHCAAMTDVDGCEKDPDKAVRVNCVGTNNIAIACHRHHSRLVHISTDYVFDGCLQRPYHEMDRVGPLSVYGHTKYGSEAAVRHHCPDHLIVRLAWLYGRGGPSFVHTMLKLAESKTPLKVVDDQIGNPTSCDAVARRLKQLIGLELAGTFHLTCEGEASWYGFAEEIFRLKGLEPQLSPCSTEDFPRPAKRPANSRLENRNLRLNGLEPMPHWKEALTLFLA